MIMVRSCRADKDDEENDGDIFVHSSVILCVRSFLRPAAPLIWQNPLSRLEWLPPFRSVHPAGSEVNRPLEWRLCVFRERQLLAEMRPPSDAR